MDRNQLRDPVRNVNLEILNRLELDDTRVYPLPGGKGRRWSPDIDPRLTHLHRMGGTPTGQDVVFYEHIATVRDKSTKTFYVAFRETVDAQLARESDLKKFPEWLMKTHEKQNERLIHIYMVIKHPKDVAVMRSQEDWLAHIADQPTFDALWSFLAKNKVIPA